MPNNALGMQALTDLSTKLKTVDHQFALSIRANLRTGVRQAGGQVLAQVKANGSWSSRIPGAASLNIRYNTKGASVRVLVDHNKAPHARPLEMGNRDQFYVQTQLVNGRKVASRAAYKAARASGAFTRNLRHPVFHKTGEPGGYANQPTRPFFFPAINQTAHGVDLLMERVAVQTAHEAGFK